MDRRTWVALILCLLIYLGWQKFYLEPRMPRPTPNAVATAGGTPAATTAARTDGTSPMTGTPTGALAQASELVIGLMASTSTGATIAASANWTLAGTVATTGARRASTVYQNVEATTTVTPSFTVSNGTDTAVVQTVSFSRAV